MKNQDFPVSEGCVSWGGTHPSCKVPVQWIKNPYSDFSEHWGEGGPKHFEREKKKYQTGMGFLTTLRTMLSASERCFPAQSSVCSQTVNWRLMQSVFLMFTAAQCAPGSQQRTQQRTLWEGKPRKQDKPSNGQVKAISQVQGDARLRTPAYHSKHTWAQALGDWGDCDKHLVQLDNLPGSHTPTGFRLNYYTKTPGKLY